MPVKSKAMLRAMGAAKNGNSTLGIPPSVGAKFIADTPKGAKLPERVGKKPSKPLADEFP